VPYVFSFLALLIAALQAYNDSLKPFALRTWVSPSVFVQHRDNLGIYVEFAVQNHSPTSGIISRVALVLSRADTPEERYLLAFAGYRVEQRRGVWGPLDPAVTQPRPLFLDPNQWELRTAHFLYTNEEEFPIASGAYKAELFIWTDYETKPRYREETTFVVSADILTTYLGARERGSTVLQSIECVGAQPSVGKKLTNAEYAGREF
jgi:hypothetical protein